MSLRKTDASNNTWFVRDDGSLASASRPVGSSTFASSALDFSSIYLYIGDNSFSSFASFSSPTVNAAGDEQTVSGSINSSGISATFNRKTTIGNGYVRIVTTYTNAGSAPVTLSEESYDDISYHSNTRVAATSSTDLNIDSTDDWALFTNASNTGPVFGRVVSGGDGSPDVFRVNVDVATSRHRFTLAAGESKTILTFAILAPDTASATTLARDLSNLSSDIYLAGLTESELNTLQNFTKDVTAAATTTLRTFERNLTLTGTANIDGTGNARNNRIEGNSGNNSLAGADGDDTLIGGSGVDTLKGGRGNDTYFVDASDIIEENSDEGTDTVVSAGSFSIATLGGLENVTLSGSTATNATGNGSSNVITGNSANNSLSGGGGDDTLITGGGTDTLVGGTGNDTFVVRSQNTNITDESGIETVVSSVSFSLSSLANIENLTLTGTAISATGNATANKLVGNDRNNSLDGGAGSDTMIGGKGNDTYTVSGSGDAIQELADEGNDTVLSSISHTLANNLENLTLTGTARNGNGNTLNNLLIGNASNNALAGLAGNDTLDGGAGTDALNGGTGNDTYIVDSTTDLIQDDAGVDTIESSISYSIAALDAIENLKLTGSAAINATGNDLDNILIGNSGNNILDGGDGIDTASFETATAGVTARLSTTAAQATGSAGSDTLINIERLRGSRFSDNLTGSDGDNEIDGGDGDDTIAGGAGDDRFGGGKGDDRLLDSAGIKILSGGSGDDTYVLSGLSTQTEIFDIEGIDTLDASGAAGGSTIDLRAGSGSSINGSLVTLSAGDRIDAPLDVLFMQDASGSFSDDVDRVKTLVPSVVQTLANFQADVRFGLASFIDKGEYVYRTDQSLTTDQALFRQALDRIVIGSGGDTPESQLEALLQAAVRQSEVGFRADSLKVAVVLTDAGFHKAGEFFNRPANDGDAVLEDEDYPTLELLKSKLLSSGVVPVFAVTTGNERVYQDLVDFLGFGTVTTLANDSSNLVAVLSEGIKDVAEARIENAIGTAFNDTLIGNELINQLTGGNGNDTYYVQNEEDRVVETSSTGGRDTVISESSFTLSDNLENLKLSGANSINATGNALNNVLHGNSGNNILDGKSGSDTMYGGRGNDTFVITSSRDRAIEYSDQGTDTVTTSLTSFTLGQNIENLSFIGSNANIGTGNSGANTLRGNIAADTLSGLAGNDTLAGGGGDDSLTGGDGNDSFLLESLMTDGIDTIADFVSGTDRIEINLATFAPLSLDRFDFDFNTKQLSSSRFVSVADSSTPTNSPFFNPTFIYKRDTGKLFYDADGRGSFTAEVEVLTLVGAPTISTGDIYGIF